MLRLGYFVVLCLGCLHFAVMRLRLTNDYEGQATIESLMAFEADLPFQYRVLAPLLMHLVPASAFSDPNWRQVPFEFFATLGSCLVIQRWFRLLFGSAALGAALTLLVIPCLHYTFVLPRDTPLWFPSDITSIFFFAAGLVFLRQQKMGWYYATLIVGSFNRETVGFLLFAYLFTQFEGWRQSRSIWIHVAAQCLVCVVVRGVLYLAISRKWGERAVLQVR